MFETLWFMVETSLRTSLSTWMYSAIEAFEDDQAPPYRLWKGL